MDYTDIRNRLTEYFKTFSRENAIRENVKNTSYKGYEIIDTLNKNFQFHKNDNSYQLKAYQYKTIAEGFEPTLFKDIPFYFEMGTKNSFSDGTITRGEHPGAWTFSHNIDILTDNNSEEFEQYQLRKASKLYCICGPRIETMHYGFPYENVFEKGLSGIYEEAKNSLDSCTNDDESAFIKSALTGLEMFKLISEKFSEKAKKLLSCAKTTDEKKNLTIIAENASKVPWKKPTTFCQGLSTIAFLRDAAGSLEGIGISSLGRPDKYLYKLYKNDIKNGELTKEEAYDLICKFLLIWDCRHDRDKTFLGGPEHELECTLELGGCDDDGTPIANELTLLFIDAYEELNCIYPKFQCRFSSKSPRWYIERISADICKGRSNYLLANDDTLIPALVKSGKSLEDARKYIVSGCWDIFCDGLEHRPGGEYLTLIKPMEWAFCGKDEKDMTGSSCSDYGINCTKLNGNETFEQVYAAILENIDKLVKVKTADNNRGLELFTKADPLPLYSICMKEPLKRRKDIHNGGAKYSPGSIYYVGFANLADSLMALKNVCYDKKQYKLTEVIDALKRNWDGCDEIRETLMKSPYFCDGSDKSEIFCKKLNDDLCKIASKYRTVTGDKFDCAYLVYVEFMHYGAVSGATPDGRFAGDMLSHGIGPGRNRQISSLTDIVNGAASIGLDKVVNSIVNIVVPSKGMTPNLMTDLIYAFGKSGLESIHLNCVSREELIEAQLHPEGKDHLIVRVCGFSAKFTSLSKKWQDEFINRNQLT